MATTTTRLEDVTNTASEKVREAADYVSTRAERMRDELGSTERRMRDLIEEYPLTCFFGAVLTGWLVGRIASRV